MPILELGAGGISITVHSTASAYCGGTSPGTGGQVGGVNVWPSSDGNCTGKKSGTLQAVLTHELAHVLGWNSGHGGLPGSRTSLTANCTTFIPGTSSSDPISDNVCLHDVEALFRAKASGIGWTP